MTLNELIAALLDRKHLLARVEYAERGRSEVFGKVGRLEQQLAACQTGRKKLEQELRLSRERQEAVSTEAVALRTRVISAVLRVWIERLEREYEEQMTDEFAPMATLTDAAKKKQKAEALCEFAQALARGEV